MELIFGQAVQAPEVLHEFPRGQPAIERGCGRKKTQIGAGLLGLGGNVVAGYVCRP